MKKTYSFEESKYEVDRDTEYGTILDIRRNGEHWEAGDSMRFSKFIHAMLNHIDEIESKEHHEN